MIVGATGDPGTLRRGATLGIARMVVMAVATAMSLVALPVRSQQAPPAQVAFDIAAGPLTDALDRLGEQSGVQVLYTPDIATGIRVSALQGRYAISQALAQLLRGSGLEFHFVDPDTIALRRQPGVSAPASAGPPDGFDARALQPLPARVEEVVVTARRREERQQDVPVTVTVLSGGFLAEHALSRLSDLTAYVPSLQVDNFNSPTSTNLGVRGVRSTDIAPGQDSTVGVYFGEFNYGYTLGISQLMFDLQSVEVLKGPQGTLFGRNSTGGALLLSPVRPGADFNATATAGTVLFDGGSGYQSTATLNLPLSDTLALRAAFKLIDRDGQVRNFVDTGDADAFQAHPVATFGVTRGGRLNADRSLAWRLGALWQPASGVESYFMYQGAWVDTAGIAYALNALNPVSPATDHYDGSGGRPSALDNFERIRARQSHDPWTAESNIDSFVKLDMHALSNVTTWALSEQLNLKNVAGWRYYDRHDNIDFDGMPLAILEVHHPDTGREFSQEIQLQGSGRRVDWVAGLYYSTQRIERRSSQALFGGREQFTWVDSDNTSMAVFGQGTLKVPALEGLSVTAGVRYTRDSREMLNRRFFDDSCAMTRGGTPLPLEDCRFHGRTHYGESTYALTVDYKIDTETLVYLAHRRGYRAGGFDYAAPEEEVYGPFAPEFVTDVELGLKKDWRWGERFMRSNVAAFRQRYDDIQRFVLRADQPAASVTNAASATISGGELELTVLPFNGLELSAFYALVVAGYDNFGAFTYNEFAQVPRHQFALSTRYRLPLPAHLGDVRAWADWSARSQVYYVDTAQGEGFGPRDSQGQAAHDLLNLGLSWKSVLRSAVDLSLYVRNATNQETRPFGVQLYSSLGYNISTIGEPRVVGLELAYRFK